MAWRGVPIGITTRSRCLDSDSCSHARTCFGLQRPSFAAFETKASSHRAHATAAGDGNDGNGSSRCASRGAPRLGQLLPTRYGMALLRVMLGPCYREGVRARVQVCAGACLARSPWIAPRPCGWAWPPPQPAPGRAQTALRTWPPAARCRCAGGRSACGGFTCCVWGGGVANMYPCAGAHTCANR